MSKKNINEGYKVGETVFIRKAYWVYRVKIVRTIDTVVGTWYQCQQEDGREHNAWKEDMSRAAKPLIRKALSVLDAHLLDSVKEYRRAKKLLKNTF